jgi:CRP-like cAMP-binding protein
MDRLGSLQSLKLFGDVPEPELSRLADLVEWRSVPTGMVLMEAGEEGDSLFVVVDGKFLVDVGTADHRQKIADVGPGEILGETCLFRRRVVRSARVAATEPSTVIRIGLSELESMGAIGSRLPLVIERAVLATLTERVVHGRELIEEILAHAGEPQKVEQSFGQRLRALLGLGK